MKPMISPNLVAVTLSPLSQGARIETNSFGYLAKHAGSPLSQGARIETPCRGSAQCCRYVAPLTGGAD